MTDISSCSLGPDALAARLAAWHELDRTALSRRPTPEGTEVRYRLEPGLAERLLELIQAEAECCPGLRFDATVTLVVSRPSVESSG